MNKIANVINKPKEIAIPGIFKFLYCALNSRAENVAKIGLTNSVGCTEKPNICIQRIAPFFSIPINCINISVIIKAKPPNIAIRFIHFIFKNEKNRNVVIPNNTNNRYFLFMEVVIPTTFSLL